MYVVVEHEIRNAEVAFRNGDRLMANQDAPSGVRVLQFFPSRDRASVVCVWEAPSVDSVQHHVDDALGDSSVNRCWEVDVSQAFARRASGIADSRAAVG